MINKVTCNSNLDCTNTKKSKQNYSNPEVDVMRSEFQRNTRNELVSWAVGAGAAMGAKAKGKDSTLALLGGYLTSLALLNLVHYAKRAKDSKEPENKLDKTV